MTVLVVIELVPPSTVSCVATNDAGTDAVHTLRPCVAATSVWVAMLYARSNTATFGKPDDATLHVAPSSPDRYTPRSVPTKSSPPGTVTMALAGTLGRLPLTLVQLTPRFTVLNTCPVPNPDTDRKST